MAVLAVSSVLIPLVLLATRSGAHAGPVIVGREDTALAPGGTCDIDWLQKAATALTTGNTKVIAVTAKDVKSGDSFGGGSGNGDPFNAAFTTPAKKLPALCAVVLNVSDTTQQPPSSYSFGMFLPKDWNNRFLTVGSSSFSGGINWPQVGEGSHYGFATASTNNGHDGGGADMRFAASESARLDWGYRAVHGTVVLAKALTNLYYPTQFTYSYYSGCSTGGRQGLREIQVDVNSFDGALIGAPAWDTQHLMPYIAKTATELVNNGGGLAVNQLSRLVNESVNQCDVISGTDGAKDGIIDDPDLCLQQFDLTKVQCAGSDTPALSGCLTEAQVKIVSSTFYRGYNTSGNHLVSKGFDVGSESSWSLYFTAENITKGFDRDYERYFLGRPVTDGQYSDDVVADAEAKDPGQPTVHPGDLSAFRDRQKTVDGKANVGGKILMYHGLADGLLPRQHSRYFWDQTKSLTKGVSSDDDMNKFFRYFEIPGMMHCGLATPPNLSAMWDIGGAGMAAGQLDLGLGKGWSVNGHEGDAKYDALAALQQWVEQGTAVDSLVGTSGVEPGSQFYIERILCPHPLKAKFNQTSTKPFDPTQWSCKK